MGAAAATGADTASAADPHARTHASPPALAEIYARYAAFVWRVVRRRGVPDAAAEDLMHEVFMVVHRRLPEYDARASMATWLFHLTRGVVSNWQRSRAREQLRIVEATSIGEAPLDPERAAARGQAQRFVHGFLRGLDADKRDVFELVELEGESVADVARSLGINLNTAYSRLRLARQAFAQAVARWHGDGGQP